MTDYVVEHLATVDVLEEKVEMTLCDYDVPHSANVWMSEECDDGCLSNGTDLPIFILGTRGCFSAP